MSGLTPEIKADIARRLEANYTMRSDDVRLLLATLAARDAELAAARTALAFIVSHKDNVYPAAHWAKDLRAWYERADAALAASSAAGQPYPPNEQLRHLANATQHLFDAHDCDHDGWETWRAALDAAGRTDSTEEGQA